MLTVSINPVNVNAVAPRNTLREGDAYARQSVAERLRLQDHTCFAVAVAWARNPRLNAVNVRDR